jgi:hypothetical protein
MVIQVQLVNIFTVPVVYKIAKQAAVRIPIFVIYATVEVMDLYAM